MAEEKAKKAEEKASKKTGDKPKKEKAEKVEKAEKIEKVESTEEKAKKGDEKSAEKPKREKGEAKKAATEKLVADSEEAPAEKPAEEKVGKKDKTNKETGLKNRKRPGPPNPRYLSKRHQENLKKIDKNKKYLVEEAISLVKSLKSTKFDETVQIVMKLGIDPKKSDQLIRGSVSLPKGIGKTLRVLVFAEGEQADQAKAAGADHVGGKELIDKVHDQNWVDFDVAIAAPAMMRFVGKLGKVLGPKGMMPSPKSGTVTEDVSTAVKEFKAGKVEYRTDAGGNVHAPVGKKSFSKENLVANILAFVEHINNAKPATLKGQYIHKIVIASTMGPGIALDIKL